MKDDIATLYAYNRWADHLILDACWSLTPGQYAAEPVLGWSSVRSSMAHIAIATAGWLRALVTGGGLDLPTEADLPTVDDFARLLRSRLLLTRWQLPTLTPEGPRDRPHLRRRWSHRDPPPWLVFLHVVNHATYHLGQVASKLKRLGVEPPATDFVFYAFRKHSPDRLSRGCHSRIFPFPPGGKVVSVHTASVAGSSGE